ncbi:DUF4230 domain-containing protein [Sphingomonas sp. SUN019]|uniref:DUF4230 domain-containing protein n=1 Tax=Sphingomonas sp. SUN019 TaxID=2937788 RepID=UPI002164CA37|nr:DUF4230 domain-containing protein [Sphingomonas sp. SUN019]UVO52351.1 DUF4230 domain-containing protein [Sphingomonas sp. SUN019]
MADPTAAHSGIAKAVAGLVLLAVVVVAIVVGYRTWTERYTVTVERERSGVAVAQVVAATLSKAGDLRVSRLSGTVQGVGSDTRGFGMLTSQRVIKAPFEVNYFVDVGTLTPRDFRYDEARKVLLVDAPDVRVERANVDEAKTYIDQTSGVFVTRAAMTAMQRQASAAATRVAADEARKPENIAAARNNARAAIAALFAAPLAAAGLDATVEVRFADDPVEGGERWDVSRSLDEVLRDQ